MLPGGTQNVSPGFSARFSIVGGAHTCAEERLLAAKLLSFLLLILIATPAPAQSQDASHGVAPHAETPASGKVPAGVILVKGAWSSATDSTTPVPEGGAIVENVYNNEYFSLTFPLPTDFNEKYKGPPPSDSGYYVLAQLRPADTFKGPAKATVLISAQDLFFSLSPAPDAKELVKYVRANLKPDYKVEREPTQVQAANRPFIRLDYVAPAANLHWFILATEIRCHLVQFVFTSQDTHLLEALIQDMNGMKLPAEADPIRGTGGGSAPVCIKDYATSDTILNRVDPMPTDHKFNPVPVRIIIGKDGSVEHIHFLSAFPDQAKSITDAVTQWKFKPYVQNGEPVKVETGIMFGSPQRTTPKTPPAKTAIAN